MWKKRKSKCEKINTGDRVALCYCVHVQDVFTIDRNMLQMEEKRNEKCCYYNYCQMRMVFRFLKRSLKPDKKPDMILIDRCKRNIFSTSTSKHRNVEKNCYLRRSSFALKKSMLLYANCTCKLKKKKQIQRNAFSYLRQQM